MIIVRGTLSDALSRFEEQAHSNNKLWFRVQFRNNRLADNNLFLTSGLWHSLWFVHAQFYRGPESFEGLTTLFVCQLKSVDIFNAKSKKDYIRFDEYFRRFVTARPDIIKKYEIKSQTDYDPESVMRRLEMFDMQTTEDALIQKVMKKLGYGGFVNQESWTYGPASEVKNCCIFDKNNIRVLKQLDFYELEKVNGFKKFKDTNEKELRTALYSII
jgi:hypothetical protein